MHDPMTVAFEIKNYFVKKSSFGYRPSLITVWHVDPEKDGTDDSCGWFMRSRHGDQKTLEKIAGVFAFEWNRNEPYERFGWFMPDGTPNYTSHAIAIAMFRIAANEHFGHWSKRAERFLRRHAFNILLFAENSCDSLDTDIRQRHGKRDGDVKEQSRDMAACVYTWIRRADRPWWRHPRWHLNHWQVQIHPLQTLRRILFSRCQKCGKGFKRNESVIGSHWDQPKRRWFEWFRSEQGIAHHDCSNRRVGSLEVSKTTGGK